MKRMMIVLMTALLLTGCGQTSGTNPDAAYVNITAEEAKRLMDTKQSYIILDVREQEEYDAGHIPGAILIPHTQIAAQAEQMLPHKNQLILVYCRSGRRSKIAAEALVELGYTNIKEFGGIIDWPYEIVR